MKKQECPSGFKPDSRQRLDEWQRRTESMVEEKESDSADR